MMVSGMFSNFSIKIQPLMCAYFFFLIFGINISVSSKFIHYNDSSIHVLNEIYSFSSQKFTIHLKRLNICAKRENEEY